MRACVRARARRVRIGVLTRSRNFLGTGARAIVIIQGTRARVIALISMPTPRGQEAQLDQVVEAHRIAREGRINNASGKEEEEEDQDQFSSSGRPAAVRAVAGWAVLGELAAGT